MNVNAHWYWYDFLSRHVFLSFLSPSFCRWVDLWSMRLIIKGVVAVVVNDSWNGRRNKKKFFFLFRIQFKLIRFGSLNSAKSDPIRFYCKSFWLFDAFFFSSTLFAFLCEFTSFHSSPLICFHSSQCSFFFVISWWTKELTHTRTNTHRIIFVFCSLKWIGKKNHCFYVYARSIRISHSIFSPFSNKANQRFPDKLTLLFFFFFSTFHLIRFLFFFFIIARCKVVHMASNIICVVVVFIPFCCHLLCVCVLSLFVFIANSDLGCYSGTIKTTRKLW